MTYQSRHVIPRKTEGIANSSSVYMDVGGYFFPPGTVRFRKVAYMCGIANIHSVGRAKVVF